MARTVVATEATPRTCPVVTYRSPPLCDVSRAERNWCGGDERDRRDGGGAEYDWRDSDRKHDSDRRDSDWRDSDRKRDSDRRDSDRRDSERRDSERRDSYRRDLDLRDDWRRDSDRRDDRQRDSYRRDSDRSASPKKVRNDPAHLLSASPSPVGTPWSVIKAREKLAEDAVIRRSRLEDRIDRHEREKHERTRTKRRR